MQGQGSNEECNVSNPNFEEVTPLVQENKGTPNGESPRPRKKSKPPVNQSNNSQFEENMSKALEIIILKTKWTWLSSCRSGCRETISLITNQKTQQTCTETHPRDGHYPLWHIHTW